MSPEDEDAILKANEKASAELKEMMDKEREENRGKKVKVWVFDSLGLESGVREEVLWPEDSQEACSLS